MSQAQELAKIRHDLLVWAGYHRGTGISEEAMPRFHEIIDHLSQLIPETIIIQGGTCWACGELGSDLTWWHVAVYGEDGRAIGNERKSYLIHKGSACSDKAIEKVTAAHENRFLS
ncbi:MAG TPA: hypothetical protein VFA10_14395 [Ktedonobacteraceae bacterium]|nr:hypothetical protein [Ktedonobacteraceae bacterium]